MFPFPTQNTINPQGVAFLIVEDTLFDSFISALSYEWLESKAKVNSLWSDNCHKLHIITEILVFNAH